MSRDVEIKLGATVKEQVSGCEGVVVAITDWLGASRRVTVQPRALKDGRPVDTICLDAERLDIVSAEITEGLRTDN